MKKSIYIVGYLLLISFCIACQKDTTPTAFPPTLTTGAATEKQGVDIMLTGTAIKDAQSTLEDEIGFIVASSQELIESNKGTKHPATSTSGNQYTVSITGLNPGEYFFCIYANSGYSLVKGDIKQFNVRLKVPILEMKEVNAVSAFSGIVTGYVKDDNGFTVNEKGFCWSLDNQLPTIDNPKIVSTEPDNTYTATIEDLEPERTYYIRAYAKNERGIGYSDAKTLTTPAKQTVTIASPVISDIDVSSAHIEAAITIPTGVSVLEKGVCYSIEHTTPTIEQTHKVDDLTTTPAISLNITELTEGAKYYVTAYARTRDGVYYSNVVILKVVEKFKPEITGLKTTEINDDNVSFAAIISNDGGLPVLERGICWSNESSEPNVDNPQHGKVVDDESKDNVIVCTATALKYKQRYYARAYARNDKGISYSSMIEFTTKNSTIGELKEMAASNPTSSTIDVSATISNDGGATIEETGFCYSTSYNLTIDDTKSIKVIVKPTDNKLVAQLTGLAGYTTYYVKAYAKNKNGVAYSGVATATTKKANPDINDPVSPGNK